MNEIAKFRKCTLTNEQLCAKVDEQIDEMYKTRQIPCRCIPARPDEDFDLLVGELILRFYDTFRIKMSEVVCTCSGETQVSRINGRFLCCECKRPLL
jgi:hypothetical protein